MKKVITDGGECCERKKQDSIEEMGFFESLEKAFLKKWEDYNLLCKGLRREIPGKDLCKLQGRLA